jgi:hypothetical protein
MIICYHIFSPENFTHWLLCRIIMILLILKQWSRSGSKERGHYYMCYTYVTVFVRNAAIFLRNITQETKQLFQHGTPHKSEEISAIEYTKCKEKSVNYMLTEFRKYLGWVLTECLRQYGWVYELTLQEGCSSKTVELNISENPWFLLC